MRQYYGEHPEEFGPPEKLRVAVLFVKDPARAREVMAAAETPASSGARDRTIEDRFAAFAELVKAHTEEPNARDVVLSPRIPTGAYPQAVMDAATALQEVGALSRLIETQQGSYVLQLKERTAAFVKPFDEVKQRVARAVSEQIRDRKVDALVGELKRRFDSKVSPDAVALLRFESGEVTTGAPTGSLASRIANHRVGTPAP
jgi:parvulin-like peptidyl-prolyl isomerase